MSSSRRTPPNRRPFEVFDFEEKWYVYCPDGCVMVSGVQAEVKDRDSDDCVEISLSDSDEEVWGHIRKNSENKWEVSFDAVAPSGTSAYDYDFLVRRFSGEYNDGCDCEVCSSAVNFGGGETKDRGPFPLVYDKEDEEDEEEEASLTVGDGYVQVGGFTVHVPGGLPAAPVLDSFTGFVCVRITASSTEWASVSFATYSSFSALRTAQENLDYVTFPLYEMNDGALVMDLRRMPSTGILEFYE